MCFLFIQTRRKIERDYEHRGISAQTVCHGQKSDLCLHTGIHILDLKDTDVVVVVFFVSFCFVFFKQVLVSSCCRAGFHCAAQRSVKWGVANSSDAEVEVLLPHEKPLFTQLSSPLKRGYRSCVQTLSACSCKHFLLPLDPILTLAPISRALKQRSVPSERGEQTAFLSSMERRIDGVAPGVMWRWMLGDADGEKMTISTGGEVAARW